MSVPSHRTPNSEGPTTERASSKPRNSKKVSTGRSQMMSTDDIGDWEAVVEQVLYHEGTGEP